MCEEETHAIAIKDLIWEYAKENNIYVYSYNFRAIMKESDRNGACINIKISYDDDRESVMKKLKNK